MSVLGFLKSWLPVRCEKHPGEIRSKNANDCFACILESRNAYFRKKEAEEREKRIQELTEAMVRADAIFRSGPYR